MDDKTRSRKWLLTINNPLEHDLSHEKIFEILNSFKAVKYWCLCDETGDNGTHHTHLLLYGENAIKFSVVKKKFPSAHIDYCRGTVSENRDYIRKEGKYKGSTKEETNHPETFEESGDMPMERQGQRNDIIDLYDMIKSGMTNYEILETNPECMNWLDKIERCRYILKQEEFKNTFRHLEVYYCFGKAGCGKTRHVMEKYGYENVSRVTDYKHPFDNYKGQDVVIFEEFRSSLKIQDMLNYLDGYPLDLPCRYNNKIACFTKVYIISNLSLYDQYTDVQRNFSETWNAFLRRISNVMIFSDKGIHKMSVDEFKHGWRYVDESLEDVPFPVSGDSQEKLKCIPGQEVFVNK